MHRGFLRLNLLQHFLHEKYPHFLAKAAIREANAVGTGYFPNEPYTPLISTFSLDYTAKESITYKNKLASELQDRIERLFHITPFGQTEFFPVKTDVGTGPPASLQLVPAFTTKTIIDETTDALGEVLAAGSLRIGLRNADLPQNISLLFQVAEGSENAAREIERITWSYLAHNRWNDFKTAEIISDTSNGLLTSGIVKLSLPKTLRDDNTLMASDIFWIKASVAGYTDAVSKARAVIPQAVQASYRKQEANSRNHLATPLPADRISALIERQAAIGTVLQPFASFGGRLAEQDNELYIRVHERLRHKARSITIYDYERIILEAFPEVYKVKCLNHTQDNHELTPGHVRVIVVPDLRNQNAVNPLHPVISVDKREKIQQYLQRRSSNFANIAVESPTFEEVKVKTKVAFHPGKDKGFYTAQLQQDIVRFLAPWLNTDKAELVFGGKVSTSALLNFIEELSYVDFLADVVLYHLVPGCDPVKAQNDEIIATTSASVLVPVPAELHEITPNIIVPC